jgi:hypothetical protein
MLAGDYLLPNKSSGLLREARDKTDTMVAEVYVSPESPAVGKSLEAMAGSIGVSPASVIKIRRRNAVANQDVEGGSPSRKSFKDGVRQIFDRKYWQASGAFWSSSSAKNNKDSHGEYNLADKNESPIDTNSDDANAEQPEYNDIVVPEPHEVILAHDIVFVSSAQVLVQKMMKSIMGESNGLSILNSDVRDLPGFGSELVECVVSDSCEFVGKKVSEFNPLLAKKHGLGLITVRGKRWADNEPVEAAANKTAEEGKHGEDGDNEKAIELNAVSVADSNISDATTPVAAKEVPPSETKSESVSIQNNISDHVLGYGDILLCVADAKKVDDLSRHPDFYVVSTVGSLPKQLTWYGLVPLLTFLALLILAALQMIDICPGAMIVAAFFFMGGWITAKDIPKMVDIRLLLLLGASISFATSMTKSGLAETIAAEITNNNPTPFRALVLVYAITMGVTGLVSNNAAASFMCPIAVKVADKLFVSYKPFAMCVMIAASATYMCPVGYQTHIMVWAPGGYRFRDFLIFGAIPNAIYLLISCYMIPHLYPF